jgi:hypothetical protein
MTRMMTMPKQQTVPLVSIIFMLRLPGHTPTPTQSLFPAASKDTFNVHFAVEPTILTTETIAAAESDEWRSSRRHLKGFGRVVEVKPGKGEVTGDDDARARVSTFRFSCFSQPTQCHSPHR